MAFVEAEQILGAKFKLSPKQRPIENPEVSLRLPAPRQIRRSVSANAAKQIVDIC
jgi:hypothetical protein